MNPQMMRERRKEKKMHGSSGGDVASLDICIDGGVNEK